MENELAKRRQTQEALRKLRYYFDRITSGMYENLMVIDRNFIIKDVNDGFLKEYGETREEVIGRTCYEVTHGVDKPRLGCEQLCPVSEVVNTGKLVRAEHVHRDRSGKELNIEIYAFPLFGEDGNVEQVIIVSHNVTDRKRVEQERMQREKFRGVLEMAGAVCHELNQPMQGLSLYCGRLLKALSEDAALYKQIQWILQVIVEEVHVMAEVTTKLQGIARYETKDYIQGTKIIDIDKAARRTAWKKEEEEPGWMTYMRRLPGSSLYCRHYLTGRIENPKICPMNYECYHCPYDQMLDEVDLAEPTSAPAYMRASGYRLADGYYYHLGHSWARIEHGGRVRVGFDDFLVKVFGPAQALKLPPLGATLKQGKSCWTLARDDHKAAVLAPVTGTVLAVNHKAREHPEITYEDPYQQGWLFIVEPGILKANLKGLYYGKESFQWIEKENQRLMKLLGPEYEQLAATGGELIGDLFGHFPEIGWDRLVETFLRTEKI